MEQTRFTQLVGCEHPIQLAPMSPIVTPELAAAVTGAGGHAMLGLATLSGSIPAIEALLGELEERGVRPYGANFLVPFLERESLEFVASRVSLIDVYLGPPDREIVDAIHAGGALAGWQVRSAAEAEAAERAGCDLIVAHGVEAGGRNPGGVGLFPLLSQVLDSVSIPVVAAGGISTGRGIAGALAMGADAVRLGTRFVAAAESGAHPDYVAALLEAGAEEAIHTDAFSVMFPPDLAGSRVLRSAVEAAEAADEGFVGEMPLGAELVPLPRFSAPPPSRLTTGNIGAMALYAGESVWAVRRVQPAAEIISELVREADELLARRPPPPA